MRSEQLLPAFNRLQYFSLNANIHIFCNEESWYLEEKLLGGDLWVEREFTLIGKKLEKVKAVEQYFFLFNG